MLKEGDKAPAFKLPSVEGGDLSLKDFAGKTVVLYFYPKDDTPGCTREACAFRDSQAALKKAGAVVLGVSPDSVESHQKFRAKYKLNFPLLADADKTVAKKYGAFGEKVMYGKKVDGHDPLHLRDRRRRGRAQGVPAGEGRRARGQGAGGRLVPLREH